MNFRKVFLVR